MTRQRNDLHSTEFGLWLRAQPEIDSRKSINEAYAANNIDFMWQDYRSAKWMLIEEKRYMSALTDSQKLMYPVIDLACSNDSNYKGFFVIKFEKTNPEDGQIFLFRIDGKCHLHGGNITRQELLNFLQFKNHSFQID
jgi:hypothetical protein